MQVSTDSLTPAAANEGLPGYKSLDQEVIPEEENAICRQQVGQIVDFLQHLRQLERLNL